MMMETFGDKEFDFVRLLTRVNHEVAYAFESNVGIDEMDEKKQVPSIIFTLTKYLYLTPK